jgi:hypothetical protein
VNTISPSGTRLKPASELRLERLKVGASLFEVARLAHISAARASVIERFPEQARPEDLLRLRAAVEAIAAGNAPEAVAAVSANG